MAMPGERFASVALQELRPIIPIPMLLHHGANLLPWKGAEAHIQITAIVNALGEDEGSALNT